MRAYPALVCLLLGATAATAADPSGAARQAFVATQDPLGEPVTKVEYLEQNWSPAQSVQFYFTPQGSQLLPYDWFLALEQADSTTPFRDTQNFLRYRYLAQVPGPRNPDGLPVGFVAGQGAGRRWLGMTCAACHTTEIRLGDTGYRVDGAPTHADVQGLLTALTCAMQRTLADPTKFGRWAAKVLGTTRDNPTNRDDLKAKLIAWTQVRVGYNLRNFPGYDPSQASPPPPTHFGRLDAVDAIVNEVFWHTVKNPDPQNPTVVARLADAAVSYPCLWDTPQHDFVEWLGIAQSGGIGDIFSLSRNVGEVIGVFGDLAIPDGPSILDLGYPSSIKFTELGRLEDLTETLWSPLWPAAFPPIDQAAAAKGKAIFERKPAGPNSKSCFDCHATINRTSPNRKVTAVMSDSGTDRRAYDNFFLPTRPSGKLEGVNVNFIPFTTRIQAREHAEPMVTNAVVGTILGRFHDAPPDGLDQVRFRGAQPPMSFATGTPPPAKYKARSLNGIWATAPYLHNGSVPTLDALLRPAAQRPKSFSIGVRTFDPVRVGYLTDVAGFPRFEVNNPDGSAIVGNSNAGHEYGATLSEEERRQLIEYLKSL